ncbi:hypothetical protein TNCV_2105921 [Trichonephila clavipes]|nr:hypothetical protein TNCV_2105921 [Trichonephila clavipes]
MACYRKLESGQTQRSVTDAVGVTRSVQLQGCRIDSRNRKWLDVDQGQVGHAPLHQHDDRYIQLTALSKQNRECYAAAKSSCSWQQDEESRPAKQYVIGS